MYALFICLVISIYNIVTFNSLHCTVLKAAVRVATACTVVVCTPDSLVLLVIAGPTHRALPRDRLTWTNCDIPLCMFVSLDTHYFVSVISYFPSVTRYQCKNKEKWLKLKITFLKVIKQLMWQNMKPNK